MKAIQARQIAQKAISDKRLAIAQERERDLQTMAAEINEILAKILSQIAGAATSGHLSTVYRQAVNGAEKDRPKRILEGVQHQLLQAGYKVRILEIDPNRYYYTQLLRPAKDQIDLILRINWDL